MSVLVLYGSTHGHTAKIASRLADAARASSQDVDLRDAKHDHPADPEKYDGVIVGASLHGGHHQREVVDWVKAHRHTLEGRPSAFFSVSLTAADDAPRRSPHGRFAGLRLHGLGRGRALRAGIRRLDWDA